VQVNAAGDLALRGGFLTQKGVIEPWKIGVVNPDNRQEVLRVFEIHDGAIATSGAYERGARILLIRIQDSLPSVQNRQQ
jgi:thiamine biosynthesis lipoprotein